MIKKILFGLKKNFNQKDIHEEEVWAEDMNDIKDAINSNADILEAHVNTQTPNPHGLTANDIGAATPTDILNKLDKGGYTGNAQDLKNLIDQINLILTSDDISLDELQEIVNFIKQNKTDLENLSVANIAGLVSALASKLDKGTYTGDAQSIFDAIPTDFVPKSSGGTFDDSVNVNGNLYTTAGAFEGVFIENNGHVFIRTPYTGNRNLFRLFNNSPLKIERIKNQSTGSTFFDQDATFTSREEERSGVFDIVNNVANNLTGDKFIRAHYHQPRTRLIIGYPDGRGIVSNEEINDNLLTPKAFTQDLRVLNRLRVVNLTEELNSGDTVSIGYDATTKEFKQQKPLNFPEINLTLESPYTASSATAKVVNGHLFIYIEDLEVTNTGALTKIADLPVNYQLNSSRFVTGSNGLNQTNNKAYAFTINPTSISLADSLAVGDKVRMSFYQPLNI